MRAVSFGTPQSKEFALPIPADQLPQGVTAVKGRFERFGSIIEAQLGICRTDAQKAVWQCNIVTATSGGATPAAANPIQLPNPEKLAVSVAAVRSGGRLGIGVRLLGGRYAVDGMSKDGRPAPVQVSVTAERGKQVAAKTGPLSGFVFS
jgi:hypothetical protein